MSPASSCAFWPRQVPFIGTDAGWSSSVARRAHNPEVAGSNPVPATRETRSRKRPGFVFFSMSNLRMPFRSSFRFCAYRLPTHHNLSNPCNRNGVDLFPNKKLWSTRKMWTTARKTVSLFCSAATRCQGSARCRNSQCCSANNREADTSACKLRLCGRRGCRGGDDLSGARAC